MRTPFLPLVGQWTELNQDSYLLEFESQGWTGSLSVRLCHLDVVRGLTLDWLSMSLIV